VRVLEREPIKTLRVGELLHRERRPDNKVLVKDRVGCDIV
jgi:hypothetical protein